MTLPVRFRRRVFQSEKCLLLQGNSAVHLGGGGGGGNNDAYLSLSTQHAFQVFMPEPLSTYMYCDSSL